MYSRHSAACGFTQTSRCAVRLLAVVFAAGCVGGCSIALPRSESPSAVWRDKNEDVTGAIHERPITLSRALDAEDWRRASAAMGTALDPQSAGAAVNWDNPESGARGAFTPVAQAYPMDGKICRAFLAEVHAKNTQERLQGAACREKSAEWTLSEVRPWKKG